MQRNLYRHLARMDDRWVLGDWRTTSIYFTCTYHNPESVLGVKKIINRAIQKHGVPKFNTNTPRGGERPKIAIVTNRWHRNHAVYKSASPLVEQLVGWADLELVWTSPDKPDTLVDDYFDVVHDFYFRPNGDLFISPSLRETDFDLVHFPDIGMSDESVWLSNTRLAPIQTVSYGHPDSTGPDNCIDYFIGGQVEKDATDAYAETCVLIPGLAQVPAWPTVERQNNYIDDEVVRINCVWGPDKYNHTLLTVLREIALEAGDAKYEFHLFGSPGMNRYAALPSFERDVREIVPNVLIHTEWEYFDYMREAEKNDFSINSFPFGGYNTLVESLWMGLPFLTIYGNRFYNLAGKWLNERVGMEENNFQSPREMINAAAALIRDPDKLRAQREHLASLDLKSCLFVRGEGFREAIDYILKNHPFTETKIIGGADG